MGFGDYPIEYDPAKHGLYDPAKYYGKPDTPFGEVKLKELPAWIGRRNKTPQSFAALCSRAFWRWQHNYVQPRRAGIASFFQIGVGFSLIFYVFNYGHIRGGRHYKYH